MNPAPPRPGRTPWRKRFATALGSRMAYVDEGRGRPVLFLHGNPTSSWLWRNVLPHVSGDARAIALDLIGMGDSDKPDIGYSLDDHCAHVEGFVEALGLDRPPVLVGHDWGGVVAVRHARRHPGRVAALALMETHLPPLMPARDYAAMGDGADFFRRVREPGTGERLVLDENVFVETVLPGHGVLRELDPDEMAGYRAPFPTARSRRPILRWAREIPIAGEPPGPADVLRRNNEWLLASALPKLLLHARPGALVSEDAVDWLRDRLASLETVCVGVGTHFVQEDAPERVGRAIAGWLGRLAERGTP